MSARRLLRTPSIACFVISGVEVCLLIGFPKWRMHVKIPYISAVFFCSFFTAFISTCIISHNILFHLVTSTYTVKLVTGTIL